MNGGHVKGCCQRCGFIYPLNALRTEARTKLKVCADCFDGPEPQEHGRPPRADRFPYPSTPVGEYVFVGPGDVTSDDL